MKLACGLLKIFLHLLVASNCTCSACFFSSETVKHLVLDFLISQGYREAAERLCEDASIPFPRDAMDNLDQRMRIRDDIVDGKVCN